MPVLSAKISLNIFINNRANFNGRQIDITKVGYFLPNHLLELMLLKHNKHPMIDFRDFHQF